MLWSNNRLAGEIYQRIQARHPKKKIDSNIILEAIQEYQIMLEDEGIEYIPGQGFFVPDEDEDYT